MKCHVDCKIYASVCVSIDNNIKWAFDEIKM